MYGREENDLENKAAAEQSETKAANVWKFNAVQSQKVSKYLSTDAATNLRDYLKEEYEILKNLAKYDLISEAYYNQSFVY